MEEAIHPEKKHPSVERTLIERALAEAMEWDASTSGQELLPIADLVRGYEILREVHRGGQGIVYEALQTSTRRRVALKVILGGQLAGIQAKRRFEREVEIAADLRHPHIVTIFDSGLASDYHFYAMDFIDGRPLDAYARSRAPSMRETLQLFVKVCDAVSYAHRHGVIHRDLKPSNILVTPEGTPYLLDFGLAAFIGAEREWTRVTQTGRMVGTLRYMAPEQTRSSLSAIDTRTDVYALGVMLYELLTHQALYRTGMEMGETLRSIREVDPPRPSRSDRSIGSELDAITLKALEKDPARRYQSAQELKEDLVAWLEGRPIEARSASSLYVVRKLASRHRYETLVMACLLLAIVGFAFVSFHFYRNERRGNSELADRGREIESTNEQLQVELRHAQRELQNEALAWFLLEWRAGHLTSAQHVAARGGSGSTHPAQQVMSFLLDDCITAEQLRASMPADQQGLASYAIGERLLKQGNVQQARTAFERSLREPGHPMMSVVAMRLQDLSSTGPRAAGTSDKGEVRQ